MSWFHRRSAATALEARPAPRRFFLLGGRRHLVNAPYMLPKDEQEINRLDFQHYMLRYALRGNFSAPVRDPLSILDVGTGTGRWAMEMAQLFPRANVVGVDLVDPQASGARAEPAPENYTFVQGNVMEAGGLPFADGSFEYVHQRFLFAAIPAATWPAVARELARVTRPGGWVELAEGTTMQHSGRAFNQLQEWVLAASARRGIDFRVSTQIGEFLRGAGLRRVTQREVRLPMGRKGGRVGLMMETNFLSALGGLRGVVTGLEIVDAATFDQTVEAARVELAQSVGTWPVLIAFGQRAR